MIDGVLMDDWINDDAYEQIITDIETYWEEVTYDE
jgi:hypothetical protein